MGTIVDTLLSKTQAISAGKSPVLIAIDGRCAAGKSTLAAALQKRTGCPVISMDHFFLQPCQRTAERLAQPGENVDHERFRDEVLSPLLRGESFCYCPYNCHAGKMGAPIPVQAAPLVIIEGSYSCHPTLRSAYDLRIFLTVNPDEQLRRIQRRNGPEAAKIFRDRWIPLEEKYFSAYAVAEHCELCFHTDDCF